MNTYFERRKQEPYYKYVRTLLGVLAFNANSVCDVGSNGTDMISWLPCKKKVSIDLRKPLIAEGVRSIKADFLKYDFKRKFDIVTCFQVLEHIDDENVQAFANKLTTITKHLLIVSVPHKWSKGACKGHLQDPVDESKFISWFNTSPDCEQMIKPVFSRVIHSDNRFRLGRLVVVFVSDDISDKLTEMNETDNWLIRYN